MGPEQNQSKQSFDEVLSGKSTLRRGDSGLAVEELQKRLNTFLADNNLWDGRGNRPTQLEVDGKFGPETQKALRTVQLLVDFNLNHRAKEQGLTLPDIDPKNYNIASKGTIDAINAFQEIFGSPTQPSEQKVTPVATPTPEVPATQKLSVPPLVPHVPNNPEPPLAENKKDIPNIQVSPLPPVKQAKTPIVAPQTTRSEFPSEFPKPLPEPGRRASEEAEIKTKKVAEAVNASEKPRTQPVVIEEAQPVAAPVTKPAAPAVQETVTPVKSSPAPKKHGRRQQDFSRTRPLERKDAEAPATEQKDKGTVVAPQPTPVATPVAQPAVVTPLPAAAPAQPVATPTVTSPVPTTPQSSPDTAPQRTPVKGKPEPEKKEKPKKERKGGLFGTGLFARKPKEGKHTEISETSTTSNSPAPTTKPEVKATGNATANTNTAPQQAPAVAPVTTSIAPQEDAHPKKQKNGVFHKIGQGLKTIGREAGKALEVVGESPIAPIAQGLTGVPLGTVGRIASGEKIDGSMLLGAALSNVIPGEFREALSLVQSLQSVIKNGYGEEAQRPVQDDVNIEVVDINGQAIVDPETKKPVVVGNADNVRVLRDISQEGKYGKQTNEILSSKEGQELLGDGVSATANVPSRQITNWCREYTGESAEQIRRESMALVSLKGGQWEVPQEKGDTAINTVAIRGRDFDNGLKRNNSSGTYDDTIYVIKDSLDAQGKPTTVVREYRATTESSSKDYGVGRLASSQFSYHYGLHGEHKRPAYRMKGDSGEGTREGKDGKYQILGANFHSSGGYNGNMISSSTPLPNNMSLGCQVVACDQKQFEDTVISFIGRNPAKYWSYTIADASEIRQIADSIKQKTNNQGRSVLAMNGSISSGSESAQI